MDQFAFLTGKPYIFVYIFLFIVVSLRSSATFWLGRYAAYLVQKEGRAHTATTRKIKAWATSPRFLEGQKKVATRGWPLITLCFFTIGIQTVILVGAGLTRMNGWLFTLAAFPGWLGWALIYSTVGMAALSAVWAAILGSIWAWVLIAVCILASGLYIMWRRQNKAVATEETVEHL